MRGSQLTDIPANSPSLSPHLTPHGSNSDLHSISTHSSDSTNSTTAPSIATAANPGVEISHRRSHSAELIELDNPQLFIDPKYSASLTEPLNLKEMRAQQFGDANSSPERPGRTGSAGNLSKVDKTSSQGSLKKMSSNNNTVQQIPSKLAMTSGSTSKTSTGSSRQSKSMLPLALAESSKKISSNKENGAKTLGQKDKKGDVIYF